MKIRSSAPIHNPRTTLLLAADVSKDTLHLFSQFESHGYADGRDITLEDCIPNRTDAVERVLGRVRALATEHGYPTVCVLCESSGGYERLFLSVARRMGLETALVSPERVHGLKKVESLDTGKTDKKDARVIHFAGTLGKTHRHRVLPEPYVLLRHLTAFHDDEIRTTSALRTRLIGTLRDLFPDYGRPAAFIFGKTGRALLAAGLLDPHRLVSLGRARVARMVRSRVRGVKGATLDALMGAAALSVRSAPPAPVAAVLSDRLAVLLSELEVHERGRAPEGPYRGARRSAQGRGGPACDRRGRRGDHAVQPRPRRRADRPALGLRHQTPAPPLRRDEPPRTRERDVQGADAAE